MHSRDFNPPAPCGAGLILIPPRSILFHFNPPAPCGAGLQISLYIPLDIYFNPPAPCGAGRGTVRVAGCKHPFQSTRPLRGGTRYYEPDYHLPAISIHPPLAGRDTQQNADFVVVLHFNPPAPCGAGLRAERRKDKSGNFNPPAPCGAGRPGRTPGRPTRPISIHPPLAGRDSDLAQKKLCKTSHIAQKVHLPWPY